MTPPRRTWRREGGREEPLRFGRLALVALCSPGKVLVSTAPGYKFQLAKWDSIPAGVTLGSTSRRARGEGTQGQELGHSSRSGGVGSGCPFTHSPQG